MARPVAFVTGASRGIGAASAIALAMKGFDVAISARTVKEGTGRSEGSSAGKEAGEPIPGSLESTATEIEKAGGKALMVPMDLLDRKSCTSAVDKVLAEFGQINVLALIGIYKGPGNHDPLIGTPIELLEHSIQGDIMSNIVILQRTLPGMIEAGGGIVINMTSATAYMEPPGPLGDSGWGFAYGVAKGGFDRMAGLINAELGDKGIHAYKVDPGFIVSGPDAEESIKAFPDQNASTPDTIGLAVAWLATDPSAPKLLNKRIFGQELCRRQGLLKAK